MIFDALSPRRLGLVGLLALVPVLGYAVARPNYWAFVAAVNVVLVVASLFVATAPVEHGHDEGEESGAGA